VTAIHYKPPSSRKRTTVKIALIIHAGRDASVAAAHEAAQLLSSLGVDVVTGEKPSSGKYFSSQTIGHLGFTGTSFWIDLKSKIVIVLLTNRVIYGNDKRKIKEFRPLIHDAVMEALKKDNYF